MKIAVYTIIFLYLAPSCDRLLAQNHQWSYPVERYQSTTTTENNFRFHPYVAPCPYGCSWTENDCPLTNKPVIVYDCSGSHENTGRELKFTLGIAVDKSAFEKVKARFWEAMRQAAEGFIESVKPEFAAERAKVNLTVQQKVLLEYELNAIHAQYQYHQAAKKDFPGKSIERMCQIIGLLDLYTGNYPECENEINLTRPMPEPAYRAIDPESLGVLLEPKTLPVDTIPGWDSINIVTFDTFPMPFIDINLWRLQYRGDGEFTKYLNREKHKQGENPQSKNK